MKKIISFILVITLILAICPLSFAADTTEGYTYKFSKDAFGRKSDDANISRPDLAGDEIYKSLDSDVSAPWRVAGSFCVTYTVSRAEGLIWKTLAARANEDQKKGCFGLKITVPEEGTYIPSLTYTANKNMPIVDIYLVKEGTQAGPYEDTSKIQFATDGNDFSDTYYYITKLDKGYKLKTVDMWGNSTEYTNNVTENFDNIELKLDAGDYYLLFRTVGKNDGFVGEVSGINNYLWVMLESFKLTPAYTETVYETAGAASVKRFTYYNGAANVIDENPITVTYGTPVGIPAVEKTITDEGKTYNFLYWAKGLSTGLGNKNILSTETGFGYLPQEGSNYLIAVYEEVGKEETATFYNANGQLLTDIDFNETTLPALPSMAGYTAPATAWVQLGDDAELKAGEPVPETGDKIFMAKYSNDDKKADISVTVNGASADSTPTDIYAYGKEIICKADTTKAETFMYWTKTVGGGTEAEVVSMDKEYSFYAWEDCTVTAVYGEKQLSLAKDMRKIIISSVAAGNESAIMAEFIGFGNALEKGVMVNGRKIAMTTTDNQFTVVTDDAVTGYAIVSDGNGGYKQITDK